MTQDTLKSTLPEFIVDLESKSRSPSTILAYKADLTQLIVFLEAKNKVLPESVAQEDIEAFRDTLLNDKYTPKSVSRKLNAVKTFFRFLLSKKYISTDPSQTVAHPKIEPSVPKFLSPIEYRALRDVVRDDARIAAIVELILQTGMRISEVANLKIEYITDNQIKIEPYATQPERVIPLNSPAKDAVDEYTKIRPETDSPYLFVSKNGKPLAVRNIRAAIDRYMQRAEVPDYSVNDLRTTFIVENLKGGVDLVVLSHIVGHKRLSTTERYLELAEVEEPGKRQTLVEL